MLRGRDIFKLPVVTRDRGEKVGEVKDLIVDRNGGRIVGLVTEEKGLLADARVVPWDEIVTVGLDAVIVKDAASVVKSHEIAEIAEIMDRGYVLHGRRVGTTEGTELGRIENFFFDRENGAVIGFELSGAVVEGATGQAFMPAHPSFEAGKDYIFVDPAAGENLEDLREALRARAG